MTKRIRSGEYLKRQRENKALLARERRKFAVEYLGGKCSICGSADRVEIDHKDRYTKSFPISRPPNNSAFLEELNKCQLLCYKCHRDKSGSENSGESHPMSKLTKVQVIEIRERLSLGGTGVNLAREYGVCPMQISRIKNGKRWRRVIDVQG